MGPNDWSNREAELEIKLVEIVAAAAVVPGDKMEMESPEHR
jgi:hypothetical protein